VNSTILLKELPFCRRQQRESHMLFACNRFFVHMKHSVNFRHKFMIMSSKRHGVFPSSILWREALRPRFASKEKDRCIE